jgi:lipopolysaccharide export system protein LptC
MDEHNIETGSPEIERRERLGRANPAASTYNPMYSKFIRRMRMILPLAALALVAVVFAWDNMSNENLVPVQDMKNAPKTIGKNELLRPKFESMDDKNQPYTITATRAVRGEQDENMVILEKPVADMLLNSGNWIALEAKQGTYQQTERKLLLEGDVKLFHDDGYEMDTAKMHIDLDTNTAWSEDPVRAHGPAGTLEATGLKADTATGTLVFNGPATLVLVDSGKSDLGKLAQ